MYQYYEAPVASLSWTSRGNSPIVGSIDQVLRVLFQISTSVQPLRIHVRLVKSVSTQLVAIVASLQLSFQVMIFKLGSISLTEFTSVNWYWSKRCSVILYQPGSAWQVVMGHVRFKVEAWVPTSRSSQTNESRTTRTGMRHIGLMLNPLCRF